MIYLTPKEALFVARRLWGNKLVGDLIVEPKDTFSQLDIEVVQ